MRGWNAMQITNFGGKYSIERMLALDEYVRNTTLLRVLAVIVVTPIPVAAVVVAQESVPLQDPAAGWSANYGFWVRFGVVALITPYSTIVDTAALVDGVELSPRQLIVFCTCTAVVYTAADMAFAACWRFPIPFVTITLSMVVVFIMLALFRLIVGAQVFHEIASRREQLKQFNTYVSVQLTMTMIYPAYQLLFNWAAGTRWELPVLMLLPVMKLVLKISMARTIPHKEDMVPEAVVFTVDFFDALYLATCIQNVSALSTVVAIMTVDFLQIAVELHELHERTEKVLRRLRRVVDGDTSLLGTVTAICRRPDLLQRQALSEVRVNSCIVHQLSPEARLLLQSISGKASTALGNTSSEHGAALTVAQLAARKRLCNPFRKVPPHTEVKTIAVRSKPAEPVQVLHDSSILSEALEALFTAECLILTEYLESIVPILYGGYVVVMVFFPSAKYHTEMEGITHENVGGMVQRVFLYAILELVSFMVLAVIMRRNCGIQALYHLAFVLETQAPIIQSKFLMWTVMTLTYRVVHFGADFSFRFNYSVANV